MNLDASTLIRAPKRKPYVVPAPVPDDEEQGSKVDTIPARLPQAGPGRFDRFEPAGPPALEGSFGAAREAEGRRGRGPERDHEAQATIARDVNRVRRARARLQARMKRPGLPVAMNLSCVEPVVDENRSVRGDRHDSAVPDRVGKARIAVVFADDVAVFERDVGRVGSRMATPQKRTAGV